MEAGKPVPIKFRSHSDEKSRFQYLKFQEEIALGEPHFKVGLKQVYFPKARVCLLRPNAKHSPYQAKFLVPRNFNKMDLRDYLWNIYGLRALNVTVQLLHARYIRTGDEYARYRGPQYKKMTIDMQEPFIWPEVPQDIIDAAEYDFKNETETIKQQNSLGSDKLKPLEAFDGIFKKHVLPDAFISRNFKRKAEKNMNEYKKQQEMNAQRSLVASFINVKKDIENRV